MKRHYTSLFLCAVTAIGGLFVVLKATDVSAETSTPHFVQQEQINTLVTMAIPPYKW